uniref:non-specific serine/threonine protein kinase n=1 Tax=Electrophorus electricus TaxID=8005 RepID=A0A4W4DZN3_ELEEL
MSGSLNSPDGNDDYCVQQENELEALASIFSNDFEDLRTNRPPPEIELKNAIGLSNDTLQNLQSELMKLALERCGEVMIYELADFVQGFLTEHNVPPSRSFHEEMLKNQQRQQERLALEEQMRLDQRRRQEEQMQNEILAEIQRREEERREEKRKKEMAKLHISLRHKAVLSHFTDARKYLFSDQPVYLPNKMYHNFVVCVFSLVRRDTCSEDNACIHEVLHFSSSAVGDILVHRGKCIGESERLGRSVYYALNATSGEFGVVYEWILHWSKKMGKFFTTQEKEKIEKCKKQIHGAESELNSLLKLDHPNLVRYQAMSLAQREDCLVVDLLAEHVAGRSLAQGLSSGAALPTDQLRHHAGQLLAALDYLHTNSVVHKQLVASSVLVDAQGDIRLTDYSLTKRLADICREDVFEQARVRFSEDALPTRTGKKGDVWSLGLLLLALSQGREVREYPVTIPSSLPADLQDFLKKCVCLNDAERWNTQQLLQHSYLQPPSPKSLLPSQEPSPEDIGVDFASTVIPRSHLLSAPFSVVVQKQFSRYYNEFEELQLLGKGAFGAVIKVQNKLDGCYYAVKRIQVNPASRHFRRIKGEVTLLSRLNHENIVRYYNAWMERQEAPSAAVVGSNSSEASSTPSRTTPRPPAAPARPCRLNELGLPDDFEADAPPPALASSVEWSTSLERSSSAKCTATDSSDDDEDEADVFCPSFLPSNSDSESDIIFDNGDASRDTRDVLQRCLSPGALSLQMEYCEKSTLRDTIDQGLYEDCSRLWRLFREILDGLAYIHEQGMIHRDLKPVNIFLDSHDHVKIGDFGLATDHPAYVLEDFGSGLALKSDPTGNMTGMVGTALYVSPEVQGNTKATYNQKVDLFSLGIILFEMSYRPMPTASERISVLSHLRKESIDFPEDFDKDEKGTKRKVICWLLNHDPALRPTAVELLKSDLLPPPQMEESELHEVLQHTMANVMGKAYRTMVNQLFSQNTSPVMEYTYDIDIHKGSFNFNITKLHQYVYETITRVFKKHGAVRLQTPLLLPRTKNLYEGCELACFMDHSGMLVTLPYDLRVTVRHEYIIERVFRPRKLDRAHPRELLECAFDIVVPVMGGLLPDAETIYTVSEVIQEFSALQERNYNIYLNHTNLLRAILLHSGVPEDKLSQASSILCDAMSEKLTRREVEAKFCNLSLSNNSLQTVYKFIEQKGDLRDLVPLINTLTKQKSTAVAQLAKQGLKDLEEVTELIKKLGVKLQVVVNLGLVYKVQHHCGVIFQFVAFIKKRRRTVPDIVAAGGRYDHLVLEFRAPGATAPVPSAVGASIALDKICTAVATMAEPPSVSSCDVLVVPVGHSSMGRAISVTQKLWTTGVSADLVYDALQSQETLLDHCRLAGITFMVLVSDKDGNCLKVKCFEKDRQSEKRIPESDLVDHIIQRCRTKLSEERNRSTAMNMNVYLVTPEKVSASARRRYETQVCNRAHLIKAMENLFILSTPYLVKHLLSRLPKQRYLKSICEEIHRFKIIKGYAHVCCLFWCVTEVPIWLKQ